MTKFLLTMMIPSLFALVSLMSSMNIKNKEKMYSFECGFNPFNAAQTPFSIQFFKIMMIFLLFDMEIIIVLPLPLITMNYTTLNYMILLILILLVAGLIFEWKEGSLQWLK